MERNAEYWVAWRRLYPEMCERLRRDGLKPPQQVGAPRGDDLTAEDAAADVAAMEATIRKHAGRD